MECIVYHGSSNPNIEELKPHVSTHQKNCIYATPNKAVALLFMNKGQGDLDTRISSVDGIPELVERRKDILKNIYDTDGYLYELDGTSFEHYDYLWSLEVVSFKDKVKPINKIYYPNILKAIEDEEKKGNIIIYRYPNRPKDMPLDNSDLIDKYIHYQENGLYNAVDHLLETYPEFTEIVEEKYKNKLR